jgi:hypothetical protein
VGVGKTGLMPRLPDAARWSYTRGCGDDCWPLSSIASLPELPRQCGNDRARSAARDGPSEQPQCLTLRGATPPVRERPGQVSGQGWPVRATPVSDAPWSYPRGCGDDLGAFLRPPRPRELPPQARGRPRGAARAPPGPRATPAGAGTTPRAQRLPPGPGSNPRRRGDDSLRVLGGAGPGEQPPQARGRRVLPVPGRSPGGATPRRRGDDSRGSLDGVGKLSNPPQARGRHFVSCGDVSKRSCFPSPRFGPSRHPAGCGDDYVVLYRHGMWRSYPAGAGTTRSRAASTAASASYNAHAGVGSVEVAELPPRARGRPQEGVDDSVRPGATPTSAGMTRGCVQTGSWRSSCPRGRKYDSYDSDEGFLAGDLPELPADGGTTRSPETRHRRTASNPGGRGDDRGCDCDL